MKSIQSSQIARRYAEAFFAVVPASNRPDLAEEFDKVITVLGDPAINRVFTHPHTSVSKKGELIRLMGVSDPLEHFLLLIVEKKRDSFLHNIKIEFAQLVLASQQITVAEIVSAVELQNATLEELQKNLEDLSGKTVRLNTKIDPRIGGGLVITIDGKIIDGSIAYSLKRFKDQLSS